MDIDFNTEGYTCMRGYLGPCCRLVSSTHMIDFNPAWIYHLAEDLTKLEMLQADVPVGDVIRILIPARNMVDEFLNHQQHTLFPETCEDLTGLLEAIDAVAPPDAKLKHQMHVLTIYEVSNIQSAINKTVDTFERECGRKFIVGLEKQRVLEPKTLIEEIETVVSPDCWNRLSKLTKREMEEAGRCLALERYTAAGFHVLRAVESETRDYVCLLLKARPAKRDWGYYIEEVLKKNGADAKLAAALDNIRQLDRNPLMHPEDWLDKDDAIGLFTTVQTALERLIGDMEKRKLLPAI